MKENSPTNQFLTTFDLEPIDMSNFKSVESNWKTASGKSNRIGLSDPVCIIDSTPDRGNLCKQADLDTFPPSKFQLHRIILDITLLPDQRCRFKSADLTISLESDVDVMPRVLRLRPETKTTRTVVTIENKDDAKLSVEAPVVKMLKADLGGSRVEKSDIEKIQVAIGSFGVGTHQAGWRFRLTDSQEIPLCTAGLEFLVATRKGSKTKAHFNVAAEIDVLTVFDKWLTILFKHNDRPEAQSTYTFP